VATGGEAQWYWDDQAGVYRCLIKWDHGPGGRQAVEAETNNAFAAWPLPSDGEPDKGLMTPLGYMPTRFPVDARHGQVYRTRAIKYEWAPDTYVAFVWRFDRQTQARQVELGVSRDGRRWTFFGDDWYMPAEFRFEGNDIHEVTSLDGLIRRDDEIWQYADYSTGRHDGSAPKWRVRLTQRLDGFVAVEPIDTVGEFTTKPLLFAGQTLLLNVAARGGGAVRVAMLDEAGQPLPGFGLNNCRAITADSTACEVSWRGGSDLGTLVDKPVRVRIQLDKAQVFAMQFTDP
jgi:hypothetical protein